MQTQYLGLCDLRVLLGDDFSLVGALSVLRGQAEKEDGAKEEKADAGVFIGRFTSCLEEAEDGQD